MSIQKINAGDEGSQSHNLVDDNISKLKALFPEIMTEGKIDFDVLKHILGGEIEEGEEYYRFTWAGKAQARREAHKPSTGTLRPCPEESVDWEKTENLYIEGDNLEVLKLLQKSYGGKIKMIYIDPPYNTGKDFVYKDNYKDNLKNYQELTGQVDSEGNKLSTNSDSDGRYHSNWLNMMYPRLRLARNLLADDGVIFMSIDDNEADNLKKLGNEVFGEKNFLGQIIWERAYSPVNLKKHFSESHDYIIVFSKNIKSTVEFGLARTEEANSRYSNPDGDPRGDWKSSDFSVGPANQKNIYKIITPSGREVLPPQGRSWVYDENKTKELIEDNRVYFGESGNNVPSYKRFLAELDGGITPMTLWKYSEVDHSQTATKNLKKLFDDKALMSYPKPVKLMKRCQELCTSGDDIVLDFFSGSATSAHATIKLNVDDGGNRKFIQVQLPESTDEKSEAYKAGYKTIAEIGKERIRRAAKKIAEENPEKARDLDLGFKVFKLDSSNILAWDGNPENLEDNLFKAQDNIKDDRSEEDVLYEVLLKYGLDLTLPISEKEIDGKKVFNVGLGALFVCLADGITKEVSEGIGAWKDELKPEVCRVVFKDSGFKGDADKTNAMQTLKRFGITEVKSI